jgi:hypothetical protein
MRNHAHEWSRDMETERLPRGQSFGEKHRAAWAKWVGMPPGLTPELASRFMLNLHGGMTIRDMTFNGEHYICSLARFEKHCQLNPKWGVAARKLSWDNFKKKSRESSHQRRRTAEMCLKGLHPMVGDNVMISHKKNRQWRQCLACRRHAANNPPMASILAVVDVIKERIVKGASISEVTQGWPTGGGERNSSLILAPPNKFASLRRTNPEFDQFIRERIKGNNSRGQRIRHTRVRTAAVRDDNNDYYKIRGLIPESNPNRDDIVARIFEDLLGGTLKREEVPARVKVYVAELNKLYPTKYAKFGNSRLLSLDEVMFDDGSTTRGDNVSLGLWD